MFKYKETMRGFVPYAWAALLVGLGGGFATVLPTAFVKAMGLDYSNTTWMALAMAMSAAACAPILGRLGDFIGRGRTLLLGVGVYTLGSVLTALARGLWFMLFARFLTGIGSAAIAPVVLSYIVTKFPREKMAKGFSLYMLISSVGVAVGPTLGGILLERWDWRGMMWVCCAICAVVLLLCLVGLKGESEPQAHPTDFDAFGAFFILLFFSFFLCAPSFGQNFGWVSGPFLAVLAGTLVCLAGLVWAEKRAATPILSGRFLTRKEFLLATLVLFFTQGLMQTNMTGLIVFVDYTQPEKALLSSLSISILYLGMSLGAVLLGPLSDKIEPKQVLFGSLVLTGLGCVVQLLFSETTPAWMMICSLGLLGLGLGGNGTILMKVVLSGLPPAQAGGGTGTYGLFRDLSAPFGVAVLLPFFTNIITVRAEDYLSQGLSETVAYGSASVDAMGRLGVVELACVGAALAVVCFLPRIYETRGEIEE